MNLITEGPVVLEENTYLKIHSAICFVFYFVKYRLLFVAREVIRLRNS